MRMDDGPHIMHLMIADRMEEELDGMMGITAGRSTSSKQR
jgi:hypothetical protein